MPIDVSIVRDLSVERRGPMVLGILCRLAATLLFGFMGALVRLAADEGIPVIEIIFFRSAFAFLPLAIFILLTSGPVFPTTKRPVGQMMRAVWGLLTHFFTFTAIAMLPLANAVALTFAAPLFLILLSGPLLKERVGARQWVATLVGFAGVAIMLNPNLSDMGNLGSAFALGSALFGALALISIRQLASEPAVVTTFYFTVATTLVSAVLAPFVWVTPQNLVVLGWLALTGLLGGLAQLLLTQSVRVAQPALLASLDYSQLLWASLLGFAIWHQTPTVRTLMGGAIIIVCGCYIIMNEVSLRKVGRADASAP